MKFIHISDCHIGLSFKTASFARALGESRRKEIKETLFKAVSYCEEKKVDILLITGDLFEDEYATIGDLKDLNYQFSKLTKTTIIIGAGNHDPIMNENSYYNNVGWCEKVHIFENKMNVIYLEDINTSIYGFSWNKPHLEPLKKEKLLPIDKSHNNILMLHGDVYNKGDYQYIDTSIIEPIGYDYVALGHIHKQDFIYPWMAYPGSLEPLDFKETGDHGLIIGEIDDKKLEAEFIPFSKRNFQVLEYSVTDKITYTEIKEGLIEELKDKPESHMYRIRLIDDLYPDITLDLLDLEESLMKYIYYVEVQDLTTPNLDIEQMKKEYEGTLIGTYISYVENLDEDEDIIKEVLYEGLKIMLEEEGKA